MIKKLPKDLANTIKAQQYIFNTFIVVKELVENALDASATKIKVTIKDISKKEHFITVEDNGIGIECSEENIQNLAIKGNTSKCSNSILEYNGYRGCALSSIRDLCYLEVSTSDNESGIGKKIEYKNPLAISDCARSRGTTVKVSKMFEKCPIRRKVDISKKTKNITEISKFLSSIIYVNEVEIILRVLTDTKSDEYVFNSIKEFSDDVKFDHNVKFKKRTFLNNNKSFAIKKHGSHFLEINDDLFDLIIFLEDQSNTQLIFVGKRLINNHIRSIINKIFKKYYKFTPTFILTVKDETDINLSNDKMEGIFKSNKIIEKRIREGMESYFSNNHISFTNISFTYNSSDKNSSDKNSFTKNSSDKNFTNNTFDKNSFINFSSPIKSDNFQNENSQKDFSEKNKTLEEFNFKTHQKLIVNEEPNDSIVENNYLKYLDFSANDFSKNFLHSKCDCLNSKCHSLHSKCDSLLENKIHDFNHEQIESPKNFKIKKSDFRNFEIIGQFNHGFICCTLTNNDGTFLILVDQHAADEIYNFENIRKSFVLQKQKLISPIQISISKIDSIYIDQFIDVFDRNGFTISKFNDFCNEFVNVNESVDVNDFCNESTNYSISTIPFYKNTPFTISDFQNLLKNIKKDPDSSNHSCDRFRHIMASKACRKSIMIGDALSMQRMREIVDHLSELEIPWECPHGRPTFTIVKNF